MPNPLCSFVSFIVSWRCSAVFHRLRRKVLRRVPPLRTEKCLEREHAYHDQGKRNHNANSAKPLARPFANGDAPLGAEQVQTIREVPACGGDYHHIKVPHSPI